MVIPCGHGKSAALTACCSLPVYPDNRTSSVSAATSQKCQADIGSPTDYLVGKFRGQARSTARRLRSASEQWPRAPS